MPKFRINFVGRLKGAIGIFEQQSEVIEVTEERAQFFRSIIGGRDLHGAPEIITFYDKYDCVHFCPMENPISWMMVSPKAPIIQEIGHP